LAAFPHDDVDDRSPVGALGRAAPRIDGQRPLLPQVERAIGEHTADAYERITCQASSDPGRSAALLRAELYRLLTLPEHAEPPVGRRVPQPESAAAGPTAPHATAVWQGDQVPVRRQPKTVLSPEPPPGTHLVVDESEEEPRLLRLADVIICGRPRPCPED